eukprot:scaffold85610_cov19-Prasinocladus_malaysianus.AAC.1
MGMTEERMKELERLLELNQVAKQHNLGCGKLSAELQKAREDGMALSRAVKVLREERAGLLLRLGQNSEDMPVCDSRHVFLPSAILCKMACMATYVMINLLSTVTPNTDSRKRLSRMKVLGQPDSSGG